ncbi:phage major capsid protein [Rhizobium sp. G187]|uniref:phage major capsid protein n=1 Tax=Rhizobium sp. G187 TaxID=3451352 RepID=UPI003EE5C900
MTVDFLEFKAAFTADDTGLVEGKAWDFSSADRVGDVIEPAAFASAVGKSLPMLFAHDQAQVLGTWESVSVDADGLKVKGRLLVDDVARAKEVRALLRAKSVTGLSVGFMTRKAAPRKGGGRTITDLDLMEVSLVAIPAHPGAQISQIKELSMTAETKTVEQLATDLKAANDNILAVTKRLETAETALARPAIIGKAANDNEPSMERKAFESFIRHGAELMPTEERKALVVSDDSKGGYLAPAEFQAEIIKNLVEISPVRQAARVGSTAASSVILPRRTGKPTASWVGETETRPETGSTYGQIEIPVWEMAAWVDVSNQLLEDAAINVEAEVASDLSEEFGRLEGNALLLGDGVKKPNGLMAASGITEVNSGGASSLTGDSLISLMYSLPEFYRKNGVWMMNGTTLASIMKLKETGTGAYVWQPSLQAGMPSTILGRPVIEAVDMPDIAANSNPIAFGDFQRGYRIFDRVAMSILRDPYTQATTGKTRFHARRRVGADVVLAEAIRKMKIAA